MALEKKIRVIVVDDSALIRNLLTSIIDEAPDMEVVATASDPLIARERIRALDPDVITLDVEMPRMDGLEFLRRLMRLRPTPVLMISSLTQQGSEATLTALELGAIDFLSKPAHDIARRMGDYADEIRDKIRAAAAARVRAPHRFHRPADVPPPAPLLGAGAQQAMLFIGASTGGTEAIRALLSGLPATCPPILVVQHMPEHFTASFAARLNASCPMRVKEAEAGEPVRQGVAYIAPGDWHMRVQAAADGFRIELDQSDKVNRHRPSVDALFDSAARCLGKRAIGVILTGMGRDGADGLRRMRDAGAVTFGQNEASCVVYGMPREAMKAGGVQQEWPLDALPSKIMACLYGKAEKAML
ncbi:protein-glutamate methylesterase/protein-glutamine glutaminase [Chromobacterium rhizoryzae]|uniref:protein-glutamate methylesterase/protein-glutamine glutaminase n=1 Tax=Chromobacterium rhizoryzae TaxID=1778675 RepID=UPI001D08FA85|nr:chemotaxis response regulator protein-glutamate methylesterase [Chromobacterium rhizoryzae]